MARAVSLNHAGSPSISEKSAMLVSQYRASLTLPKTPLTSVPAIAAVRRPTEALVVGDDPATSFVVLALQHPDVSHLAKSRLAGEACQHGESNRLHAERCQVASARTGVVEGRRGLRRGPRPRFTFPANENRPVAVPRTATRPSLRSWS